MANKFTVLIMALEAVASPTQYQAKYLGDGGK
jgi:hypothetical protein